jgi:hypothetical protein
VNPNLLLEDPRGSREHAHIIAGIGAPRPRRSRLEERDIGQRSSKWSPRRGGARADSEAFGATCSQARRGNGSRGCSRNRPDV